jgi:hypothetical protein
LTTQKLLGGVSKSKRLATFIFRQHGTAVRAFAPLLRSIAKAEKEIALLERAFLRCLISGSEASFRTADAAATRLRKLIKRLPAQEQDQCAMELERRMQTLNNKRDGFGRLFVESVEKSAVKASSRMRSVSAKKHLRLADQVLSAFGLLMDTAIKSEAAVGAVWKHFRKVVTPSSRAVRSAVEYLATHQEQIKALTRASAQSTASRLRRIQALRGYLVNVRGYLAEGYALLNKVWKGVVDTRLQEAEAIASKLGPGHEVHYLTQLDNGIHINVSGAQGPDALIVIVNRKTKQAYIHTFAQVKAARTSKAIGQTVKDQLRLAGEQINTLVPRLEFTLNGKLQHLTIDWHPLVEESIYVINAAGSRIPKADLDDLKRLGRAVTELELDISVDQFTRLAVSMLEAALNVF